MTKKCVEIHGRKVFYSLNLSKRARRVKLTVYFDGNFVITAPKSANHKTIQNFILKKSDWIINKIDYFKNLAESAKKSGKIIIKGRKRDYLKNKEKARIFVENKINLFNKIYEFKINRISVKNQKTCWGSCSKKGNLNFNYKIIFLPDKFADYIVAHEVCHLKELNHSKNFWDLVKIAVPNCLETKKELRKKVINFY